MKNAPKDKWDLFDWNKERKNLFYAARKSVEYSKHCQLAIDECITTKGKFKQQSLASNLKYVLLNFKDLETEINDFIVPLWKQEVSKPIDDLIYKYKNLFQNSVDKCKDDIKNNRETSLNNGLIKLKNIIDEVPNVCKYAENNMLKKWVKVPQFLDESKKDDVFIKKDICVSSNKSFLDSTCGSDSSSSSNFLVIDYTSTNSEENYVNLSSYENLSDYDDEADRPNSIGEETKKIRALILNFSSELIQLYEQLQDTSFENHENAHYENNPKSDYI